MRKIVSISLLSLYLLASVGLTLTVHYCGGDLASLTLFDKINCCCDEKGKADNCCKNEIKTIKISDDQIKTEQQSKLIISNELNPALYGPMHNFVAQFISSHSFKATPLSKPPERFHIVPSYKRNHCFLFYC
jgi:hypothetical protein